MTIPIVPSPFSFLASAGQALGNYGEAKKAKEEEEYKRNSQALTYIMNGVFSGKLPKDTLEHPDVMQLMKATGMPVVAAKQTAEDELESERAGAMPSYLRMMQANNPDLWNQFLATGTVPGPYDASKLNAERAGNQVTEQKSNMFMQDAQRGLTVGQRAAVTGIPTAGAAAAGEQKALDVSVEPAAQNVVSAFYNSNKRLPTVNEAYSQMRADPRMKPFMDQLTPQMVGDAIEAQRRQLKEEELKSYEARTGRINANNYGQYRQGLQDKTVEQLNAEADNLQQQMNAMVAGPGGTIMQMLLAKPQDQLNPQQQAMVAPYRQLEAQRNAVQEQLGQLTNQRAQRQGAAPRAGIDSAPGDNRNTAGTNAARMKALEYIKSHPNDPRWKGKDPEKWLADQERAKAK